MSGHPLKKTFLGRLKDEINVNRDALVLIASPYHGKKKQSEKVATNLDVDKMARAGALVSRFDRLSLFSDPVSRRTVQIFIVGFILDLVRTVIASSFPEISVELCDYGNMYGASRLDGAITYIIFKLTTMSMYLTMIWYTQQKHDLSWVKTYTHEQLYENEFKNRGEREWKKLRWYCELERKRALTTFGWGGPVSCMFSYLFNIWLAYKKRSSIAIVVASCSFSIVNLILAMDQALIYSFMFVCYILITFWRLSVVSRELKFINKRSLYNLPNDVLKKCLVRYYKIYQEVYEFESIWTVANSFAFFAGFGVCLYCYYVAYLNKTTEFVKFILSINAIIAYIGTVGVWFIPSGFVRLKDREIYNLMCGALPKLKYSRDKLWLMEMLSMMESRPLGFRIMNVIMQSFRTLLLAVQELAGCIMLLAANYGVANE